ncbi:MAG: D-glucuronyl C5-epimerase family protein [Crocinitomicaceae bacterium]|nr:D-glucuronyl C5-epimerase family protein [Crocinitomicaceae bacterium]
MRKPKQDVELPVGNVSLERELGKYYQDFTQSLPHFEENYFGDFDNNGLPMVGFGDNAIYNQIYIIQFGLIAHDLVLSGIELDKNMNRLKLSIQWLEENEEKVGEKIVWRNHFDNPRYGLESGWISGMYQGQAMSLYLRYGQMIGEEEKYTSKAEKVYAFFDVNYENGGVKRFDNNGLLWFEEYPSMDPSFVLNGFVYALFGLFDLWRITEDIEVKQTIDSCIKTLKESLHLYDSGYWSVYDQLKKELATKYYHQNIHIPLMEVLYMLTGEEIFDSYHKRWKKQLNSGFSRFWVKVMYRIQPRLRRISG